MLSILVPIYNFDVRPFIKDLARLAETCSKKVEIICLDDASDEVYQTLNESIASLPNVRYMVSSVNLGRSGIRNRLLQEAHYDLLLFLDCDGKVMRDDYLLSYLQHADAEVVYGGRTYANAPPESDACFFHWYCGKTKEEVPAEQRVLQPFKSFMTNNFLIQRQVYESVGMDEALEGYGHEDTLFAAQLKRAGYHVTHIDNPIEHLGLEPIDVFLDKSRNAIKNLAQLINRGEVGAELPLVRVYFFLKQLRLHRLFGQLVLTLESNIMRQLSSSKPSLKLFDLWKLALLCSAI